jgi:hypothetical protein
MSISSGTSASFDRFFEVSVRCRLNIILWEIFRVPIFEPVDGFNRKFEKNDLTPHPPSLPYPVEIDFFAHTTDISSLNLHLAGVLDYPLLRVTVHFPNMKMLSSTASSSTFPPRKLSPEKTQYPPFPTSDVPGLSSVPLFSDPGIDYHKYVIGEFTSGGRKSLPYKAEQLEKDCSVSMWKRNTTDVLEAVAFALVACPYDTSESFFAAITRAKTPNLHLLLTHNRVVFLQIKDDPASVLAKLEKQSEHVSEGLDEVKEQNKELNEKLEKQIEELKELKELNEKQSEQNKELNEKLEEQNKELKGLNEKVGAMLAIFASQKMDK